MYRTDECPSAWWRRPTARTSPFAPFPHRTGPRPSRPPHRPAPVAPTPPARPPLPACQPSPPSRPTLPKERKGGGGAAGGALPTTRPHDRCTRDGVGGVVHTRPSGSKALWGERSNLLAERLSRRPADRPRAAAAAAWLPAMPAGGPIQLKPRATVTRGLSCLYYKKTIHDGLVQLILLKRFYTIPHP
jgi:hypothetical protein